MSQVLRDLRSMKAPDVKMLTKKNDIQPFTDATSLEFLMVKNDCSLFSLASHTKKRPNNLTLGRSFDGQLLDMVELGVNEYKSLTFYKGAPKKRVGSKPMFLFQGAEWETDDDIKKLKNLILDWFRGEPVESLMMKVRSSILLRLCMPNKLLFLIRCFTPGPRSCHHCDKV